MRRLLPRNRLLGTLTAATFAVAGAVAAAEQPCGVVADGAIQYASITDALENLPDKDGHHLLISGTCREIVWVSGHRELTIEGQEGAELTVPEGYSESFPVPLNLHTSDNVQVANLKVTGLPGLTGAVSIWYGRSINFEAVTIEDSGTGIWVIESTGIFLRDMIIQNNGLGIRVDGPAFVDLQGAWLSGSTGTTLLQGNSTGVFLNAGARFLLRGDVRVRDNGVGVSSLGGDLFLCCQEDIAHAQITDNRWYGVLMRGGDLQIQVPGVIENNGYWGLVLIGTPSRIWNVAVRGNGSLGGGGVVSVGGLAEIRSADLSGNHGDGVLLLDGATGRLFGSVVDANASEGVDVQSLSVLFVNATSLQGNGAFDLRCSPNSHARGSKAGIGRMACGGFDQGPDPVPGPPD